MKKFITLLSAAIVLASGWLIYSKVAQARRDATYRASLEVYQHDLPIGMARDDVQKYLDSRKAPYHWASLGESAETYLVQIGEEPGPVCKSWKVFIALGFSPSDGLRRSHARTVVDPSDKLSGLHVERLGTCL